MILNVALYVAAVLISVVLIRIAFGLLKDGAQRIQDRVATRHSWISSGAWGSTHRVCLICGFEQFRPTPAHQWGASGFNRNQKCGGHHP